MKNILRVLAILYTCFVFSSVFADQFRDYYAEPGLHPFKDSLNQHFNEHIDPFGGTLQLSYIDLKVPGNGGLDINIYRTYTSLQEKVGPRTVSGVGWTMHQGRILVDASNATKICSQGLWSVDANDNPSLELPDGSRETLFYYVDQNIAYLMTKNRWKAECKTVAPAGLIVTSPDGTQYVMDQYEYASDGVTSIVSYYTSQIRDLRNNTINVNYKTGYGYTYIDTITASDGRSVQFTYTDEASNQIRLNTITANGQTWTYSYEVVQGLAGTWHHLTEVKRSDNLTKWQYTYHPQYLALGQAGSHSLKTVTYPHGGTISYTYTPVYFDPVNTTFPTTSVDKKTIEGRNITPATWTFSYDPASTIGIDYDKTTVTAPNGKYVYEYFGYSSNAIYSGTVWKIGLLRKSDIYDTTNNLIQTETNTWGGQVISYENYSHGRSKIDSQTVVPLLTKKVITRDGTNYTTDFLNYDIYGNVGQIVETGNVTSRTTNNTYYVNTTNWIVKQLEDEAIVGVGTIDRTFNSNGTLRSESKYGVLTEYTYYSTGDLYTVTDARGKLLGYNTQYRDYYRGIPREEVHPVSGSANIILRRAVNSTGTVRSKTDGRGYTTNYTYDGLNRLKTIDHPKVGSADVAISYPTTNYYVSTTGTYTTINTGMSLQRGNYLEVKTTDGFGRPISIGRKDTVTAQTITTTLAYDALGQTIFQSYPNSSLGTSFNFDPLGRQIRLLHADNSSRRFEYLVNNQIRVTNERNYQTTHSYEAFGNPDNGWLIRVLSPENILTVIDRNLIGKITSVRQGYNGGSLTARTYGYDSRYFLTSITNPELGTTTFGRDAIGNMISKKIGTTLLANYQYDYQNRQTYQDYSDSSLKNVSMTYDGNNNVKTLTRGAGDTALIKSLTYDENNNLQREDIQYYFTYYSVIYNHTNLDFVNTITYPSGRVVTYAPNAFGRPTRVSPYITSVLHHPSGQIKQLNYANGQTTDITLTTRLWVNTISTYDATSTVYLDYGYDYLGNIESILNGIDISYDRSFTYDGIDRLKTADGVWGAGTLTYDALGNIKTKTIGPHSLTYSYNSQTNRLDAVSGSEAYTLDYDLQGNIVDTGSYTFNYDEANNLVQASIAAGTIEYRYDGNDRRVHKTDHTGLGNYSTYYIYAQNDSLLGEYDSNGVWEKEFIYLGSQQVAQATRQQDPIPTIPTSITVPTISTDGNYSVSWGASTQFDGINARYELYESGSETFDSETQVYSGTGLSATFINQPYGVYYYRVRACNYDGCSDFLTAANSIVVASLPGAPGSITAPDLGRDGNYDVSWTVGSGVIDYYELYEATLADFSDASLITSTTNLIYSFSDKPAGTYYYQVRACNMAGCSDSVNSTAVLSAYPTVLPTINVPVDITIEATDNLTPVDLGEATATDDIGAVIPTADNLGPYPIGVTVVTWSAINSVGTVTGTQQITVTDTTAPVISVPADVSIETEVVPAIVDIGTATATDISLVTITNDAPADGFPLGTTIVNWTAEDESGNTTTDTQNVTVSLAPGVPIANAGPDQIVKSNDIVVLDGTGSTDTDGVIRNYAWEQITGPTVYISNSRTSVASFIAPNVASDTVLTFKLTIMDDDHRYGTDMVDITVQPLVSNQPPVANAGADQTVVEGDSVILDASGSNDPDGAISSYSWQQNAGPTVSLSDNSVVQPSFTAPEVTDDTVLTFVVTVTDDVGATATDEVNITVQDSGPVDTTPPSTTGSFIRNTVKGVTYFEITLNADEPATTYFRLTGEASIISGGTASTDWQTYTRVITVQMVKGGTANFEYYSVDTAGNTEVTKTEVLQ